jgi:hypothetical protein
VTQPKILFWDIETTHNVVAVFRLYGEDYISPSNLIQERYIVCAAWKWAGQKKVHSVATTDFKSLYKKNPHDDKLVVETLHEVLSEADIIVAHNGDKYDTKFFAGRALHHALPPLPPIVSVDTLKVARSRFLLNSNKLDYLGQYLGLGKKISTAPGLWLRVLQGDPAAVKEMVHYCKGDVTLLEDVFEELRPYVPKHLVRLIEGSTACPRCGGDSNIQSRGKQATTTQVYQRFQCLDCGGWFRLRKADPATPRQLVRAI